MDDPYRVHEGTALWKAVEYALAQLEANGNLRLTAAPEYAIGHICETLLPLEGGTLVERDFDNEEPYYRHSATLRIFGDGVDFEEIERTLALKPSYTHRKGESRSRSQVVNKQDMWSYQAPIPREQELEKHVEALREAVVENIGYLKDLKRRWNVDVFCGYTSNSATAGFQISPTGLRLFGELEIPLSVSVIVT